MATSRLTMTLRCASRRAPVERLTVSIAGSSCGVIPTAMDSANNSESSASRPSAMLTTKIPTAMTAVTRTRKVEYCRRPAWNAVSGCRSPSRIAIAPKAVRRAGLRRRRRGRFRP